jgi:hypothetical protein
MNIIRHPAQIAHIDAISHSKCGQLILPPSVSIEPETAQHRFDAVVFRSFLANSQEKFTEQFCDLDVVQTAVRHSPAGQARPVARTETFEVIE